MMEKKEYKRFWLFNIPSYYPLGGLSDLVDRFDTSAEAWAEAYGYDYEVWDSFTDTYVARE